MINIGILGFGTVGSGVAEVIDMNSEKIGKYLGEELRVKRVLDLRDFPDSPYKDLVTHDADEFFSDNDIRVVVETIGGARIAYEFTKRALSLGKSVVTSNKELVSTHGVELMELAKANNCTYLYEAAVGGGIPIIRPLNRDLAANKIVRIAGIVNGTTNYVLTKMRDDNMSYEDSLKRAQEKGFAELNPSADVDGIDAQRKLSILSTICLEGRYVDPSTINTTGISAVCLDDILFAEKIGSSIKLLAIYENDGTDKPICYVAPFFVAHDNLLASVNGVFNAIMVEGNALGKSIFYGRGAGKLPTASAVVGDVVDACLHLKTNMHTPNWYVPASGEPVIADYDSVVTSAVVMAPNESLEALKSAFASYEIQVVSEDSISAVIVSGVSHKTISDVVSQINGAKWFHYMA